MVGRRQLAGKNWAGGTDLVWKMRRGRDRGRENLKHTPR